MDDHLSKDDKQGSNSILIIGAGPCGLLTAALLLQRDTKYQVTLVDVGDDLNRPSSHDSKKERSWLIGLSETGIDALSRVPGLYEEYVKVVGTSITSTAYYYGEKRFLEQASDAVPAKLQKLGVKMPRNFVVDRHEIVKACAKFLHERHGENPNFVAHWNTKVLYVDSHRKRVLVRRTTQPTNDKLHSLILLEDKGEEEWYIDYDYLIGCDGVRSIVRATMQTEMRNLSYDMSDTFSCFKSLFIEKPAGIPPHSLLILVESLPNITMIAAPHSSGILNLLVGHFKNNTIASDLLSRDIDTVEKYVKAHFKAFPIADYSDFAKQWVNQEWSTTSQLHCSSYHSEKLAAIIMGDAAHATSPTLSLGMNTGLEDARALDELLDELQDDWAKVLPAFSTQRVKEGQALTDLSFHLFALRPSLQLRMFAWDGIRDTLWRWFPKRVKPSAVTQCMLGVPLSEVYRFATKTKRLSRTRPDNHSIQRKHFEKTIALA
jgi:kynurenine 3-monooxygenase